MKIDFWVKIWICTFVSYTVMHIHSLFSIICEGFYFEFLDGKWSSCSQSDGLQFTDIDTNLLKLAQKQPASNAKHGMADRQDNEVN